MNPFCKRPQIWAGLAALLTALVLAPGRAASAPLPAADAPGVGVTLSLDRATYVVPAGAKTAPVMRALLTLFNHTATPLKMEDRGKAYDFEIDDAQGRVLWDWAKGKLFPHYVRLRILTQGELTYTQAIPLQSQDGLPLPPGRYVLRGTLFTGPGASASLPFTVSN